MAFHTPHGSARYRLPWSWSSFDYRELCRELWAQCDARFEIAKVEHRDGDDGPHRPRRHHRAADRRRARLAPRARPGRERPAARRADLARAGGPPAWRRRRPRLLDRPLRRPLRLRLVGAGGRRAAGRRRLLRAAPPRQGADARRWRAGSTSTPSATRATGSRTRCARPPRTACSSPATRPGHCLPLSGEGIRTAFYFGIACGRELRAVLAGERTREQALRRLRRVLAPRTRAPSA